MTFTNNCMGCHQQASVFDFGNGITTQNPPIFVQTNEFAKENCSVLHQDEDGRCFAISDLPKMDFLTHRLKTMNDALLCLSRTDGGDVDRQGSKRRPDSSKTIGGGPAKGAVH